jgi:alcohol dehydrogenase class IV
MDIEISPGTVLITSYKSFVSSGVQKMLKPKKNIAHHYFFKGGTLTYDSLKDILCKIPQTDGDIIAIGGGSVMDLAKMFCCSNTCYGKRIVFIPTTYSGAHRTGWAVYYSSKGKETIKTNRYAYNIKLIPELTHTLSPYVTATSGIDVFVHALETYEYGLARLIYNILPFAVKGNKIAKERLLYYSDEAGISLNTKKTGLAHALSYGFTAHYGMNHGQALAIVLPYVLMYNNNEILNYILNTRDCNEQFEEMTTYITNIGLDYPGNNFCLALLNKCINKERLENNDPKISVEEAEEILKRIIDDRNKLEHSKKNPNE